MSDPHVTPPTPPRPLGLLRGARLIAAKDLRIEARTREVTATTGLFAFLVVVMAALAFYLTKDLARQIAPGVLFVSLSFAGVLGMGRSWARERELGALRGLLMSPIPRASIYLGKLASTTLFLGVIALMLLPTVGIFFHLEPDLTLLVVALITVLTCFGFAAAGTLFAALTVQTRARDLMLSVVVFPLVTPTLLAGVLGAREVLGGAPLAQALDWLLLLGACDLLFLSAGVVLFETLLSD
ncbi:MAG: heme exporter protein CcmB [Sandaracinaceae bacterium]|nr:heme exporter protein CcmB [Sandaracinaceae bacterium]